jgi:Dolichyl-phosphate-mannose-protein mannosyltransferase
VNDQRPLLDRFLATIPIAIAALVVLSILFWEAAVRKTPTIFTDELKWTQISRAIWDTGRPALRGAPTTFGSLYSYLLAPVWALHTTGSSYAAAKYLNTIVMASAAIPVYLLARRLVSPRAAAVAAVGAMCTSALFYAPLLLPEVLAYPAFAWLAYVSVRALEGRSRRWWLAAAAVALVAVEVRRELAAGAAALVLAAAALWWFGPRAKRLREGWSTTDKLGAAVLGIGVLVLLSALAAGHSKEWSTVTQGYKGRLVHLGLEAGSALTIGLGVLPVIAGLASLWLPERRDDERWRAFAAFFAASIAAFGLYTAIKATYLSVIFGTFVEERNLIYLGPLLLVGTVVYFSARRPSLPAVLVATAVAGWLILDYGYQLSYPYFEAPGYGITQFANRVLYWNQPAIRLGLVGALAVALAIALIPFVRRLDRLRPALFAVVVLVAAAWLLTGEVTSARGSQAAADAFVRNLPQPLDWVDRETNGSQVTYLGQALGPTYDYGLGLTEFWNRSIHNVWTLDGTGPGPGPTLTPDLADPSGRLRYDPGDRYVLEDNGVQLIGRPLDTKGSLTLVQIAHPWQLSQSYYNRSPDGWVPSNASEPGVWAYFGPAKTGTLHVDVSRAGFCAKTAPPTPVTVRVGPVALNEQRAPVVRHATWTVRRTLHSCQDIPLTFHTRAPVAVEVHVSRLVRPSDYGVPDSRLLGAVMSASFTPDK